MVPPLTSFNPIGFEFLDAVASKQNDKVQSMLKEHEELIGTIDEPNFTRVGLVACKHNKVASKYNALHFARSNYDLKMMEILLKCKNVAALLIGTEQWGYTPLTMICSPYGRNRAIHQSITQLLVNQNIKISYDSHFLRSALYNKDVFLVNFIMEELKEPYTKLIKDALNPHLPNDLLTIVGQYFGATSATRNLVNNPTTNGSPLSVALALWQREFGDIEVRRNISRDQRGVVTEEEENVFQNSIIHIKAIVKILINHGANLEVESDLNDEDLPRYYGWNKGSLRSKIQEMIKKGAASEAEFADEMLLPAPIE